MRHPRLILPLFLLLLTVPTAAQARKPADALKGKIVLSTKPFPVRFKSDAAFIRHMRKVDTKAFRFDGADKIGVEFMAFFARPVTTTQLTAKIYDVTERRQLRDTFPVYPGQRNTRILASYFEMKADKFEVERRYHMVLTAGFKGRVLAETTFAIKADKK